jgi:hypothetical protein
VAVISRGFLVRGFLDAFCTWSLLFRSCRSKRAMSRRRCMLAVLVRQGAIIRMWSLGEAFMMRDSRRIAACCDSRMHKIIGDVRENRRYQSEFFGTSAD